MLLFQRADRVHTLCEIKYTDAPVGTEVVNSFEKTVTIYKEKFKNTIHRVLISAEGAHKSLVNKAVFDRIVRLKDVI